jgi:hypothetical protein
MNRLYLLTIASAILFFCTPTPADEMAMSKPAVAEASDTKHVGSAESLSECNDMNSDEMTMSQSRARARNCGQQTLGPAGGYSDGIVPIFLRVRDIANL